MFTSATFYLLTLLFLGTTSTQTDCVTKFSNVTVSGVAYYLSRDYKATAAQAVDQCNACHSGSLADLSTLFVSVGPVGESYYIGGFESTTASPGSYLIYLSRSITEIVDGTTPRNFICTSTAPLPPSPSPPVQPTPGPGDNGTIPLPPLPPQPQGPLPPQPQPQPPLPPQPQGPLPPQPQPSFPPQPQGPPPVGPFPPLPPECVGFTNRTIGGIVYAFSNSTASFQDAANVCATCFLGSTLADVTGMVVASGTPSGDIFYVASYETTPPWNGYALVWQGTSVTEHVSSIDLKRFVCAIPPPPLSLPTQCPSFSSVTIAGKNFRSAEGTLYNWFTAQSVCSTCLGGRLADIDDAVLRGITAQPLISPLIEYWIGSWNGAGREPYLVLQGLSVTVRLPDSTLRRVLCSV